MSKCSSENQLHPIPFHRCFHTVSHQRIANADDNNSSLLCNAFDFSIALKNSLSVVCIPISIVNNFFSFKLAFMTSAFFISSISVNFTFRGNDVMLLHTNNIQHICLKSIYLWNLRWIECGALCVARRLFVNGRSALASQQSENESFQFNSVRSTKSEFIFNFVVVVVAVEW